MPLARSKAAMSSFARRLICVRELNHVCSDSLLRLRRRRFGGLQSADVGNSTFVGEIAMGRREGPSCIVVPFSW